MNLVPFAQLEATGALVDVSEVLNGKKCGCICPSCKRPLVAKQGEVYEWHFSHDGKFDKEIEQVECDYSWHSAIKLMLKQLIVEGQDLASPEYNLFIPEIGESRCVTTAKMLKYVSADITVAGLDAVIDVEGVLLGIFFAHKGRSLGDYSNSIKGLIEINLDKLQLESKNNNTVNSTKTQLKTLLCEPNVAKTWLFHVREASVLNNIKLELQKKEAEIKRQCEQARLKEIEQEQERQRLNESARQKFKQNAQRRKQGALMHDSLKFKNDKDNVKSSQKRQYYCVACQHTYQGTEIGINPCPKCSSHFYRSEV
ncbi:competence protein CoiA family protein [Algibacillus agarilyticus]|uniref:competence protein CoiA family protein n=1 Tax=Algibacillus agarilyticus TaxID=2234133 RepID=UPI000DD04E62|nr:competence protein CoiA family protein [Algibacillus agarilyticus]